MLIGKLFFVWLSLACLGFVILFEVLSIRRLQRQMMRELSSSQDHVNASNTDSASLDDSGEAPV